MTPVYFLAEATELAQSFMDVFETAKSTGDRLHLAASTSANR
ncbi:MAG: hypothetical protein AAFR12_00060 [Cyanobacteria bacterium J06626_6]